MPPPGPIVGRRRRLSALAALPSVRGNGERLDRHGLDADDDVSPDRSRSGGGTLVRVGSAPACQPSRSTAASAFSRGGVVQPRPRQYSCWLDLRGGEQVGEGVQIVADADPALGAGLERCRTTTRERVEDHVSRARVACDERMGEGSRETREIRAHRMEGMAPQSLLGLPFGCDRDRRQRDRHFQGQLLRGGGRSRASRSGRHGRNGPLTPAPIPVGAMGRGV